MSIVYKRLINELNELNELNNNLLKIDYKLYTIDSQNVMFKNDLNIIYKKKKYNIKVFYDTRYPFNSPLKIEINNNNIFDLYKNIMIKNSTLINHCLYCNSILNNKNWNISKNIINILNEVFKIINYKELYIKRILLNKIVQKYTDQHLDYLEQYLL